MSRLADRLQLRPDVNDRAIAYEVERYYRWLRLEGEYVMDVGAHIGAFVRMAHEQGAAEIHGYEPDLENYLMASKNCLALPGVTLHNVALVSTAESHVPFFKTKGNDRSNFSTVRFRGRVEGSVPARNFMDEMRDHLPTVLKIDAEGAEYDLLREPLPYHVKQVAMELHFTKREWREREAHRVISLFEGWECVVAPVVGPKNWHSMAGWRRA